MPTLEIDSIGNNGRARPFKRNRQDSHTKTENDKRRFSYIRKVHTAWINRKKALWGRNLDTRVLPFLLSCTTVLEIRSVLAQDWGGGGGGL